MIRLKNVVAAIGTIAAIGLMVAALWAWGTAGWLVADSSRPDLERYAVRSAAIASGAIAQLLLLTFVAGRAYQRRQFVTDVPRLLAGAVGCVAIVSALALGLAGR